MNNIAKMSERIQTVLPATTEEDESQSNPSVFELNFSEFPIAHLTNRLPKDANKHEIRYCDIINGKDGNLVRRNWTIKSSAKHGLGGPSSVNVLFELMQIWKEQEFVDNKIHIGTYYNLLRRLGWNLGAKSYNQLKKDLESLYGLEIIAENAFYDITTGKYVDQRFKPFIGWRMWKKDDQKHNMDDYGYIVVHPDFHEIFVQSIYQLPFESSYFHGLSPHEQKLALYLTKVFNPYKKGTVKSEYRRNIYELCEQLPIYGTQTKQKYYLRQAAEKLIAREYPLLESYEIKKDIITFYNRQQTSMFEKLYSGIEKSQKSKNYLIDEITKVCGNDYKYYKHYEWIAKYIPDHIIYESLSRAKQEGKPPAKLFNYLIKEYWKNFPQKKKTTVLNKVQPPIPEMFETQVASANHENITIENLVEKLPTEKKELFLKKYNFFLKQTPAIQNTLQKQYINSIGESLYDENDINNPNLIFMAVRHYVTDEFKVSDTSLILDKENP